MRATGGIANRYGKDVIEGPPKGTSSLYIVSVRLSFSQDSFLGEQESNICILELSFSIKDFMRFWSHTMRHRQATLGEIARKTDVSITTVSRVLSGKKLKNFSEETILRIKSAAAELKYRPNRLVQGIQTGRTGIIGVVMPAYGNYYGQIMAGIHDTAVANDRVPLVLWTRHDSPSGVGKSELEQIHTLVDLRVEGIILKPIFDAASDEYLREIFERSIPLVVVDRELPNARTDFVGTDDEAGIQAAVQHLIELKHRRIAYFGPQSPVSTGIHRLQSFIHSIYRQTAACEDGEVEGIEHLVQNWTPGLKDAIALLKRKPRPTAVVAVNDDFAHLIYQAARELRLRIPEDLSVIGFGNLPISRLLEPSLSTLDQHPYDIGQSAARRLLSLITDSGERARKVLLPADLIIRGSTAPARGA